MQVQLTALHGGLMGKEAQNEAERIRRFEFLPVAFEKSLVDLIQIEHVTHAADQLVDVRNQDLRDALLILEHKLVQQTLKQHQDRTERRVELVEQRSFTDGQ